MDEYIKKQDVLQKIESDAMWNRSFSVLYEDIEDMNPEDVAPVRHGYLEKIKDDYFCEVTLKCSICREEWHFVDFSDDPDSNYSYNYCPNCGAKMDGGENNDKP